MDAKTPPLEPIAITGFSFKMPQGAVDEESLWDILERGANVKSEWPADRATADAFYDNGSKRPNTVEYSSFEFRLASYHIADYCLDTYSFQVTTPTS